MIGNIYYAFGGLLILALLKILTSFRSFYKIGEWQTKFQKITSKKPIKSDFRSIEEYNLFQRSVVISLVEILWIIVGLFTASWSIFLSIIILSQLLRIVFKPIKYTLPHFVMAYTFFIIKLSVYCYLFVNHFFLHKQHLELLNYF